MDKTLIQMCGDLPKPIQDMIPERYDTLWCDGYNTYYKSSNCQHLQDKLYTGEYPNYVPLIPNKQENPFKIPTQEMIQTITDDLMGVTSDLIVLSLFKYWEEDYAWGDDFSMLWLCFMMNKCFNMEWNNCEWVMFK